MNANSPLLNNTLGHCAGILIFSILVYLFFLDWRRSPRKRSGLPTVAATLGLIWNIGDLVVLAPGLQDNLAVHLLHVLSFAALSLLPAVLLHIWLQQKYMPIWISGYGLSMVAVIAHSSERLTNPMSSHRPALMLIAVGFSGLTAICVILSFRQSRLLWARWRLVAAMSLLLPAIFFVYFNTARAGHFHHAGIPLSLFVLLIDYRFLLLDAFVRFMARGILASGVAYFGFALESRFHFVARDQFEAAVAFAGVCIALIAFTKLSSRVEGILTRFLFRRPPVDPVLAELRALPNGEHTEEHYLNHARQVIEMFFDCRFSRLQEHRQATDLEDLPAPAALLEKSGWPAFSSASWAEAVLPLRFSRGDARLLLLGPRRGGRRYLSDDVVLLARFGKIIEEQIERRRHLEMQTLASKAELRALQAQINPHFFFNALNTLYGTISRDNTEARRLVLNLADVFRYFLRSDRMFITLEEELKIVRAYLEIEALRLGPKLTTTLQVEEDLLDVEIPVLSIQPLVENAVKHGVAPRSAKGFVRVTVTSEDNHLKVEVVNTGREFSLAYGQTDTDGIGLCNVQRRLALCYGFDSELYITSKNGRTAVGFSMPLVRRALANIGNGSALPRTA
jgi:hypothetical protein